jgi:hypothetical protein
MSVTAWQPGIHPRSAALGLSLDKKEEALEWCSWCLEYAALPEKRQRLYRLPQALLNFHQAGDALSDYGRSLRLFYNEDEIHEAESVLNGTSRFPGLDFGRTWKEISSEQRKLLTIYRLVNNFKAASIPVAGRK